MSRRVLVTGGAGFIGSNVADLFLEQGWAVDIIDNLASGKRENVPAAATLHLVDIRSEDAAKLVATGSYDAIIHLAAQIDVRRSVDEPTYDASVNILGTLNLLEALRKSDRAKTTRFAFSSTGGAIYGDFTQPPNFEHTHKEPDSPYAIGKLTAEYFLAYYARIHGLDTVAVRFGNVYGSRQDPHGEAGVVAIFCGRILAGRPLTIFGDGLQTRDYVHVADVASAIFRVATGPLPAPGGVNERSYNVGTGVGTSVVDLAKTLLAASGMNAPNEFAPKRPGELQDSCLNVDKSRTVLGWAPRVSLAEGLANTFAWSANRQKTAAAASRA